ncbi:dephospho-CoA kinase [Aequitasia blattaphilus]|uniref:Dephospho-CoA kinase n=1 Tax=Aequitasia blattaphilus TaxID=2949332 RepID=A0ABT1E737_9FIRM|nr:dephospho-CoA kinase [Aequitasia blattaphilus]MCP1101644.1 dephospho-CoA kinase [Aequitasia blattaphilus]MCR8614284.1 dephospho-CoA kinase [Aequitasia blattaphilus]
MMVIGITGGIGSGKSDVLEYLHDQYGATIVKADEVAKKLQKKGTDQFQQIVELFGADVLDGRGALDRKKLSQIVFSNNDKLLKLNQIMHPGVKTEVKRMIEKEEKKGTNFFFIEAALLLEDHYEEICEEIWYIYVEDDIRMQRLKYARGYSSEKAMSIMKNQESKDAFFKNCDRVIDNNSTFLETTEQVDDIMKTL